MIKLLLEILIHLSKKVIDLFFDLFVNDTKKEILEDDEDALAAYKERFGKKMLGIFLSTIIIGCGVTLYALQNNQESL